MTPQMIPEMTPEGYTVMDGACSEYVTSSRCYNVKRDNVKSMRAL